MTKTKSKKKTKKSKRRYLTDEEKGKLCDHAEKHGVDVTEKKFKLNRGQIYRFRSQLGRQKGGPNGVKTEAVSGKGARKSKKMAMKAIVYASDLQALGDVLMYEQDDKESALACYAGASALREKSGRERP